MSVKFTNSRKEPPKPEWPKFYDRVILLVRDPFDTLLAEFNRRKTENHTGLANLKEFQTKNWIHYVETQAEWWKGFYKFFMENYQPSQLHIVQYENLKTNLTGELQAMLDFLKFGQLQNSDCILAKKQGKNKRPKPKVDLRQFFSPAQTNLVNILKDYTYDKLSIK